MYWRDSKKNLKQWFICDYCSVDINLNIGYHFSFSQGWTVEADYHNGTNYIFEQVPKLVWVKK